MISENSVDSALCFTQALGCEEDHQTSDDLVQNLVLALPAGDNLNPTALLPHDLLQEIHDPAPLGAHQVHVQEISN
jgi:hypothetical protein